MMMILFVIVIDDYDYYRAQNRKHRIEDESRGNQI